MRVYLRHLTVFGRGLTLCLFLLTHQLPGMAWAAVPRGQATETVPLTPGRMLQREIGGSETHAYSLELKAKEYVRVLVEQQGIDVVLTMHDLDGKRTVVDRPNVARGREAISYIASQNGIYRLEVRTLERAAPRGRYTIGIEDLRAQTARDESRLTAEQAVTEGEVLRARKTAVSLPQGLEKFNQAVALWRALDEPYEVAVALFGRCVTQRQLGNSGQAVTDCGESLAGMRDLGDAYGMALARTGRAWAYIYLGEADKALADFTESLTERPRLGDRQGESFDRFGIGWAYALRGEYHQAVEEFQRSIGVLDELGDPRGKALRLASIGEIYRRTGEPALAAEFLDRALQLSRATGSDRNVEADVLTGLGWCRLALGQTARAQEHFAESLPMRRAVGDRTGEAVTLLGLAHVERGKGNLNNARGNVEAALAIIESLRAQVARQPLRLSFSALTQDYYEFYTDLLMQMHRLDPARGLAAPALEVSERARARSLLDLLNEAGVDVREGVPAELLEREKLLRSKLNAAANYQRQLLGESYTVAQAAAAAKDVDDLTAAVSESEARIRQTSPRYAALVQPQPLSAAAIQSEVADADSLLLEYALGKERSYLWAVTPTTITAYELPPGREIEATVIRLRENLTARNVSLPGESAARKRARVAQADAQYREAATLLSNMILAPVVPQLGAKRLVIITPGALQLIPFGALPLPTSQAPNGDTPLIVRHEIITLPSASTMALLRRDPARRPPPAMEISIIADPVFSSEDERFPELHARGGSLVSAALRVGVNTPPSDNRNKPERSGEVEQSRALPRLFRTRWEAQQIAALVPPGASVQMLDFSANRDAVIGSAVGSSRIVHFATHAIIEDRHPELSGIALSMFNQRGQSQDGFLRAHDIFNLKLSADLVVLSACRTSLGRDVKGEGLISLARGFMYAGAPRFVGSLWAADDKATAELMVRFYRKIFKDGLKPAAALRAAQLEMLQDKRWNSPYFWGAFVLQGEWR